MSLSSRKGFLRAGAFYFTRRKEVGLELCQPQLQGRSHRLVPFQTWVRSLCITRVAQLNVCGVGISTG